jgi:uracil permease
MLTMGLGGAVLSSGNFAISGIGLAAVVGVVLNLLLPKTKTTEEKKDEKA